MLIFVTRKRRNLASAFVGEISAILALLEDIAQPPPSRGMEPRSAPFVLPRCELYKANAGQIDLFDAPLPHQLTHFYTRLGSLPEFLRAHRNLRPAKSKDMSSDDPVAMELEHLMTEGEDLLRQLRPFVSKSHSPTINRA
jgi:hypothetical protein